ncbi:hypothetical protein ACI2LJ_32835 [Streptomyces sp. NPDC088090]|uniref:hypothetical protein n=1 Tax=Streptomyces sp. NPDC088090 TaxID=3365822 RepID=UPI00384B184E
MLLTVDEEGLGVAAGRDGASAFAGGELSESGQAAAEGRWHLPLPRSLPLSGGRVPGSAGGVMPGAIRGALLVGERVPGAVLAGDPGVGVVAVVNNAGGDGGQPSVRFVGSEPGEDAVHDQADHRTGVLVTTHYMQEAQQCDRLTLMSRGRAVASGTERDIISDTRACEVDIPHWAEALAASTAPGCPPPSPAAAYASPDTVRDALTTAKISAHVHEVTTTLKEKMTTIDRTPAPD